MKHFKKPEFLGRFGGWLSSLRKSRKLSQDTLTEKAGLARGTVSKIENGNVDPKVTTLAKLAHALRVPLWRLFTLEKG